MKLTKVELQPALIHGKLMYSYFVVCLSHGKGARQQTSLGGEVSPMQLIST